MSPEETICMKFQNLFSRKTKTIFQNVVCCNLYPVCKVLRHRNYKSRMTSKISNIYITNRKENKSCRRTASSPAGYILYCNIFIIKPYNIGHTDLDVFVCKSFCHLDIIIQV